MPAPILARLFAYMIDRFVLFVPQVIALSLLGWWIAALLEICYFVTMEASKRGATVGKMALALRVEDVETAKAIGFRRSFVRFFSKIVGVSLFFTGALVMFFNPRRRALHDYFAGSVVVVNVALHEERKKNRTRV